MRVRSRVCATKIYVILLIFSASVVCAQELKHTSPVPAGVVSSTHTSVSAASAVESVSAYIQPRFIGTYRPDGTFAKASQGTSFADEVYVRKQARPAEVPPWVDLHSIETVVEDYSPPAHARESVRGHSALGSLRDDILTFIYGREKVLLGPTHLTTDSRQRLIVADPDGPSVHVLDDKRSFRIVGGPGYRLHRPNGVAVDNGDNIYVADSGPGRILVYDSQGHFTREIGTYQGESLLQDPAGIAIDRKAGHLYVLDSPSDEMIIFDLLGNVLKRVGGRRHHANGVTFNRPTEIAVGSNIAVVLDAEGSRIQVFDLEGNPQNAFRIRAVTDLPGDGEIGLAVDNADNIYVSQVGLSVLRIYAQNGRLIGSSGDSSQQKRKLQAHSGLWIDPANRIYISDSNRSCVQVLQANPMQQP